MVNQFLSSWFLLGRFKKSYCKILVIRISHPTLCFTGPSTGKQSKRSRRWTSHLSKVILLTMSSQLVRGTKNILSLKLETSYGKFTFALCGIVDQLMAKRFYYMKSGLRTQQSFIRRGLEHLRISSQYRVRILQSPKDICQRFWLANFFRSLWLVPFSTPVLTGLGMFMRPWSLSSTCAEELWVEIGLVRFATKCLQAKHDSLNYSSSWQERMGSW